MLQQLVSQFTRYLHEKVISMMTCSAGQENEAREMPTAGIDWGRRKLQEAAAVLELLVNASLLLSPIDAEALRYVCKTARLLQVMLATQVSLNCCCNPHAEVVLVAAPVLNVTVCKNCHAKAFLQGGTILEPDLEGLGDKCQKSMLSCGM